MIYVITRDTAHDGVIGMWTEHVFANLELCEDGFWQHEGDDIGRGFECEMEYEEFLKQYGLRINKGEKKLMVCAYSWRNITAAPRKENEDAPISVD